MERFSELVHGINAALRNVFLIIVPCGVGIYLTIRTKAIRCCRFKDGFELTFGSIAAFAAIMGWYFFGLANVKM